MFRKYLGIGLISLILVAPVSAGSLEDQLKTIKNRIETRFTQGSIPAKQYDDYMCQEMKGVIDDICGSLKISGAAEAMEKKIGIQMYRGLKQDYMGLGIISKDAKKDIEDYDALVVRVREHIETSFPEKRACYTDFTEAVSDAVEREDIDMLRQLQLADELDDELRKGYKINMVCESEQPTVQDIENALDNIE